MNTIPYLKAGQDFLQDSCFNETSIYTFRVVNGVCLTVIGVLGFILSSSVVVLLSFGIVKLPERKSIFIINVAANDVFVSIVGTMRGLGLAKSFVAYQDDAGRATQICQIYALISSLFKNNLSWVLVPLTLDRFLAVVFATKYTTWVTRRTSLVMIAVPWALLITLNVYDFISLGVGKLELKYSVYSHKCTYSKERSKIEPLILLLVPMITICILYLIMFIIILRHKIKSGRFFISTTAIIITGLISTVPEILISSFEVETSHEVFMVFSVTFFYINGICNPLIYLGSHRRFQRQMISQL